jgi:hypothetical protein
LADGIEHTYPQIDVISSAASASIFRFTRPRSANRGSQSMNRVSSIPHGIEGGAKLLFEVGWRVLDHPLKKVRRL